MVYKIHYSSDRKKNSGEHKSNQWNKNKQKCIALGGLYFSLLSDWWEYDRNDNFLSISE